MIQFKIKDFFASILMLAILPVNVATSMQGNERLLERPAKRQHVMMEQEALTGLMHLAPPVQEFPAAPQTNKISLPPISELFNAVDQYGYSEPQKRGVKRSYEQITASERPLAEGPQTTLSATDLFHQAYENIANKDYFAAIGNLNMALDQEECTGSLMLSCYYYRGLCHLRMSNFRLAASDSRMAINISHCSEELNFGAFINLTYSEYKLGQYNTVIQYCDTILNNTYLPAYYRALILNSRGAAKLEQGKHYEAFRDFQGILKLFQENTNLDVRQKIWNKPEYHFNIALCQYKFGNYMMAIEACKMAYHTEGVTEEFRQKILCFLQEIKAAEVQAGQASSLPNLAS